MIKISKTWVGGIEGAVRGMRNPFESNAKSDSRKMRTYTVSEDSREYKAYCAKGCDIDDCWYCREFAIGDKDMELAKKLIRAGSEHRKFLRMIHVQADVTAPRFYWAEMDKYKFVEANSSSTMHLITKRPLMIDDFSTDDDILTKHEIDSLLTSINQLIANYQEAKKLDRKEEAERCFIAIKQLLPESYNQLRTIDADYECLLNIYHQRKNHRLPEWGEFCSWVASLPYMEEFINA